MRAIFPRLFSPVRRLRLLSEPFSRVSPVFSGILAVLPFGDLYSIMREYSGSDSCKSLIPAGLYSQRGAGGMSSALSGASEGDAVSEDREVGAEEHWWAMSAVYNRSLQASSFLSLRGIEHYVPLRVVLRLRGGRKVREEVPAVSNLIFIRCSASVVRSLKVSLPYLQYLTCRDSGRPKGRPIVVPSHQMSSFISLSSSGTERADLLYFRPEELDISRGVRVRLHGGALDGVEGTFLKVTGARERRVVVVLDGVLAVAASVRPEFVEVMG